MVRSRGDAKKPKSVKKGKGKQTRYGGKETEQKETVSPFETVSHAKKFDVLGKKCVLVFRKYV